MVKTGKERMAISKAKVYQDALVADGLRSGPILVAPDVHTHRCL
jgi:hypothetical protein